MFHVEHSTRGTFSNLQNKFIMADLKSRYRDLETETLALLREKINNSNIISKHSNHKVLQINVEGFTEVAIIHDRHTLINENGDQFSIFYLRLEELIDIL